MSHKVTVITSVFEAGDMMQPFLDDLLRQTIFDRCLFHLVCCNDNYTHPDEIACHEFQKEHPSNVRFTHLKNDPGIYGVWNHVVKAAKTQYLTNANVDDRMHPECIEKHIRLLDEKPEIDLAYCYNICTFEENDSFEETEGRNRYPTAQFNPKRMLRGNLPHNHPVWRASLHEKFGYFDESIFSAADWEFWLRCVAGGTQFELIPEDLGLYYWNPKGISTNRATALKKSRVENNVRRQYQEIIK